MGSFYLAAGVGNEDPAIGTHFAFVADDAGETLALTRLRIATGADGQLRVAAAGLTSAGAVIPESGRAALAASSGGSVTAAALARVVVALRSFGGCGAVAGSAAAAAVEAKVIPFAAVAFLSDDVGVALALAVEAVALGRSALVAVATLAILQIHGVACFATKNQLQFISFIHQSEFRSRQNENQIQMFVFHQMDRILPKNPGAQSEQAGP